MRTAALDAQRMRLVATTDLGGRPDSLQIMLGRGHVFVTHPFSRGVTVLDVRNPRAPRPVAYVPAPDGTLTLHLQLVDDILLVSNEADTSARQSYLDRDAYFGSTLGADAAAGLSYRPGVSVYDVSTPAAPRAVGFLDVGGFGVHRLWWDGGRRALASVMGPGRDDFELGVLDMSDPAHPEPISEWRPSLPAPEGRTSLHHAILANGLAFGAWRALGLQIVDVTGEEPALVGSLEPGVWGGGNTHTTLPLPGREIVVVADESVADAGADDLRRIWLIDVTDPTQPSVVSVLPEPGERDFRNAGATFGPHNLHENRAGTWQSEDILFATYQNAGVRVYDISDAAAPTEVAWCVPPGPARTVDPRVSDVRVPQTSDVLVTQDGLVFASDLNAGLSIIEYLGAS